MVVLFFFFQAEDGIRDLTVTGVQTCALPISIALTPLPLVGSGTLRPFYDATIEEDPNGLVPRERALEVLVEVLAIASDDDELPKLLRLRGLLEKARERHPRLAPTGRALLVTKAKALVAIETQDEMPQREMHLRRR